MYLKYPNGFYVNNKLEDDGYKFNSIEDLIRLLLDIVLGLLLLNLALLIMMVILSLGFILIILMNNIMKLLNLPFHLFLNY